MVAFYIAFIEAEIGEPSVEDFAYICCIKAFAKNEGFWYSSKRGPDVGGIWRVYYNMGSYKDENFFYPSECPGEFRFASK